jgi:C1A family cysteine protease
MSPASNTSTRRLRRILGASLLLAVALSSLLALSGGLPAATGAPVAAGSGGEPSAVVIGGGVGGAPPWESAGPFPAAFDLRDSGWLTGVRSQDSYSTCWIMAAMGSLESSVLRREGLPLDFSENNLANHMASRLDYEGMAPSELALAYFARWEGPVRESADRYPRPGKSPPYLRAVRHLQEALFLPARQGPLDNAAAKWAITTYGGLDAAVDFRVQEKHKSWDDSSHSYYNATRDEPNHHVLVVGWDDGYPASRFLAGSRPPGDGAFLIQNSWGADFADEGYAWVSYYDATIGDALVAFSGVEAAGDYDAIYQYDALGRSAWLGAGAGEVAWFANRFTAAGTGTVAAVSFYAPVTGTAYEVRVAGRLGEVAAAPAAAAGAITVPGYHTVRLERPASVSAGKAFVVAVRVVTPGWDKPVPVEAPSRLIAPRARAGQSFVSADGSAWSDLTELTALPGLSRANVCLKGFVDAAGAADTRAPRVAVRGGTVRRGAQAHIRWWLQDPAFSSGSAIVELSVRDAAGRVVAQRRIPAVAVGERGVWTPRAGWSQGRYSVSGRAYDVAGHRQAAAGRATVVVRGAATGAAPALRR